MLTVECRCLINAGATFQRAMDYTFHGLVGKSIIIYMDDLTVFSKYRHSHVDDLSVIFERCRKFGISLNPKTCIFGASKGRLLGHIISEHGISVDPESVQAIQKIFYHTSLKEVRSFMGKINFVRKFISGFAKVVKPIIAMMKNKAQTKWDEEARIAFRNIKDAISRAPVLTSPNYKKPFYLYSFASKHSMAGTLTPRDEENQERLIVFMSSPLKDAALKYSILDKQAYALVKVVKKFRHYILRSRVIAIVFDSTVKSLLAQHELGEKRGNWVSTLQEYDLTIRPMKIVRRQGLTKTLAQYDDDMTLQFENELNTNHIMVCQYTAAQVSWYEDMTRYLTSGTCPRHFS